MTRLRRTIAARLKEAQNTAAMLTTFNEVDMSAVMALRNEYRDAFEKKHDGVRLGFMSFFVKACVAALKEFPAVNAEIDGDDIVYKNFVHMGIAVGGPAGLVVPVIRDVDAMSFAEIERAIADFGRRARDGALKLEELTGGTFSITNGGVYGSLMSTPILNPPQSGILGMHKIQERPMAVAGKIETRPMMYLALSYDHRIVDGREAVSLPGAREGRRGGSAPVVVGALADDVIRKWPAAQLYHVHHPALLQSFEVYIHGQPASAQTARRQALQAWKQRVREACEKVWADQPPMDEPVIIRVTHYCETVIGDVDNLTKPIQDALQGIILSERQAGQRHDRQPPKYQRVVPGQAYIAAAGVSVQ